MQLGQYLIAEKIKPQAFADAIGKSRRCVEHLIAKRNKPGPEVMSKVIVTTKGKVLPNDFYQDEIDAVLGDS